MGGRFGADEVEIEKIRNFEKNPKVARKREGGIAVWAVSGRAGGRDGDGKRRPGRAGGRKEVLEGAETLFLAVRVRNRGTKKNRKNGKNTS